MRSFIPALFAALLLLSGCASRVPQVVTDAKLITSHPVPVSVTAPTSQVKVIKPEEYAAVVRTSITACKAFAEVADKASVQLAVNLIEVDEPFFGFRMTSHARAEWVVTAAGQTYSTIVSGTGSKGFGDSIWGDKRSRLATRAAIEDTIRKGLEWVSTLPLTALKQQAQRVSPETQRLSQTEQQTAPASAPLASTIPVAGELPAVARTAIAAAEAAVGNIHTAHVAARADVRRVIGNELLKDAESEQRQGNLDTMIALQTQVRDLDKSVTGMPMASQARYDQFRIQITKLDGQDATDEAAEWKHLRSVLDKQQSEAVKAGDTPGALAIRASKESLDARIRACEERGVQRNQ